MQHACDEWTDCTQHRDFGSWQRTVVIHGAYNAPWELAAPHSYFNDAAALLWAAVLSVPRSVVSLHIHPA